MAVNWTQMAPRKDLSDLAKDAMWVTSQAGGNMLASNEKALTAPGSQPVDNLNARVNQMTEDPTVEDSNETQIPPGTSGKPQASGQQGAKAQARPSWGKTIADQVIRDDSGATAERETIVGGMAPARRKRPTGTAARGSGQDGDN